MTAEEEPFVFEIEVKKHAVSGILETYVRTTDMDKHRAIDTNSFDNIYTTHILVFLDRFWMTLWNGRMRERTLSGQPRW